MHKTRKPHEERTADDYRQAAEESLELAKVLAGQGGISDGEFLERMARSDELADLGFCKIARSELIFRHSALRTPFHDAHPTGQNTDDAVAEPEHEEWVMQEWKRFEGVNP